MSIVPGRGPAYLHSFSKPHAETVVRGTEQPIKPRKSVASTNRPKATVDIRPRLDRHEILWEGNGEAPSLVNVC